MNLKNPSDAIQIESVLRRAFPELAAHEAHNIVAEVAACEGARERAAIAASELFIRIQRRVSDPQEKTN